MANTRFGKIPGIEDKTFYVVWNPRNRNPLIKHETEKEAINEADRLAETHPGQHFYVLESQGYSMSRPQSYFKSVED